MSDFSVAYHLKTDQISDVVDLLSSLNIKGYVFQPTKGWVTFVTELDEFEPHDLISKNVSGTLLFLVRTNDFLCWNFEVFLDSESHGRYAIQASDELHAEIVNTLSDQALSLLVAQSQIDDLTRILNPVFYNAALDKGDLDFAELVGLENIEWISYFQVDCNVDDYEVVSVQ